MDLLNRAFGWVKGKVVDTVVDSLPIDNKYPDLGGKGKLVSYVENQPVIGALLKSLGPNRGKLYGAVLTENADDMRTNLRKLPLDLPLDDNLSKLTSGFAVHSLYSAMLHPPQTYLGNKFQYRSADGSDNNMLFPQLGKAGMPYAKSVPNVRAVHGSQPDPGDLFDLLLARDETDEEDIRDSNLGISSMLLYHATVIIHDIFRTNVGDKNISDTSSYLDLSPLYGKDAENQKTIRSFKRGLLKPDSFAEERLLNQPVGVCIYLIMYNRFHNYVAQQLLEINENGKFLKPPSGRPASWRPNANWQSPKHWAPVEVWKPANWQELDPAKRWSSYRQNLTRAAENNEAAKQEMWILWKTAAEEKLDEDLFQTARLITCGMYINISVHDYLRVLTRVHLKDTPWTLDPRKEIPIAGIDPRGIQRGQGNQVSVEFNVLYRFHSPLSRRDMKWTSTFLRQLLQGFVKPKDGSSTQGGPSLTQEQLDAFDIPIPVMSAALAKMYAMLPTIDDKVVAPAMPIGLEPILEGDQKGSYRFKRDPRTQKFNDLELVREMVKVMEDPTCEFGAKNTARLFRSIEVLGILQARKWELASLNEFRKFFGLREHTTFEDINQDPDIARKLRNLYRHPDQVELYPGLVCEGDRRCLDPGTECPNGGTALWSAVFSDAVTLVRSDRFYTTDWNVGSLTGWGMREVSSVPEVMKGSVMHRLFQRAFPGFFTYNSLHLWQPFHIPAMNYVLAKAQSKLADLEDLSEMGIDAQTIEQAKQVVASMKEGPLTVDEKKETPKRVETRLKALDSQIKPLKELEEKRILGYTRTETAQIRDVKLGKPDTYDFVALQLAFKPLKRLIRMPESRFDALKATTIYVSNYSTIVDEILAKRSMYKNPGFLDYQVIPGKPLRAILTGKFKEKEVEGLEGKVEGLVPRLRSMVTQEKEQVFMKYFTQKAQDYLSSPKDYPSSGKRDYQKLKSKVDGKEKEVQVWQIDIVSDYAMPIVAQFIIDFLGFWDWIDPETKQGAEDAKVVYEHLSNCQDYLTYDSDETTIASRRIAFKKSIRWLNDGAKYGVEQVKTNGAKRGANSPEKVVSELRQFGTQMALELLKRGATAEEAAAMRLSIALDAVHKSILTFTEVLNYLLHKRDGSKYFWEDIQSLAFDNSNPGDADRKLSRCVLEAQRLAVHVPLVRQIPNDATVNDVEIPIDNNNPPTTRKFQRGDVLLLQVDKAQQDPKHFPNPTAFNPQRREDTDDSGEYIIYGRKKGSAFTAKHLTIIAITALIKQAAKLKKLRRAHNTEGRLNTAKTPDGVRRYLTQEFDQLVPFPTTWQLRFDGEGQGVWEGDDNSEVEHGMEQVYQDGALSADGGSFSSS